MAENNSRNLTSIPKKLGDVIKRRNIVMVIGINDYVNWPKLHNAVSDALGIHKLFVDKLGFLSPIPPFLNSDATQRNLLSLVQDQLYNVVQPDDSLILFFAGHGHTRLRHINGKTIETGYIVPVEAGSDQWGDYIKIDYFLEEISQLPARHILVILDACHSGFGLGNAMNISRSASNYEQTLLNRMSRKVITSARRDESALDGGPIQGHSLFTGTLVVGLDCGKADLDNNGLITSSELGLYLQQQVGQASGSKQTPDFGSFHLDDRGEMVISLCYRTFDAFMERACTELQKGDAESIDKAIEHFNQAILVQTIKDSPVNWAEIKNSLANSYHIRIKGDKAENIEKAIEHYNQALIVRTQMDLPKEWAETQYYLANAYYDRIKGVKAENIEKAIEHYNQALIVRTINDFPVEWAETQNELANAYRDRIRGDRVGNIEKAIEHYGQALHIRTINDFPVDWAETQNNLANAYRDRIRGDKAENIEKAIEHYMQALRVRTKNDFPVDWANTQNNLANAYLDLTRGDKAENIEKAIEHYNNAFFVRKIKDFSIEWAETQNNLANAFRIRIKGDKAENIEKAIKHYSLALLIRTSEDFPVEWAETQNNLAKTYRDCTRGDKAENIVKAISHCHKALEIYKLESMPTNFRNVSRFLGDLYLDIDQWEDALKRYIDAIKAGDLLYRSGLSAENKTIEVEDNAYIYRNAALASCRLGLPTEALLILEKGKTRLLNEALQLKMKKPLDVPNEEWINYEEAAKKYRTITMFYGLEDYAKREKIVQKILKELDASIEAVQRYNHDFQKELEISDILTVPDMETALLTFCITDKGSIGFVISGSSGIQTVEIPSFKTEDLNNLLLKSNEQGHISGWVGDYTSRPVVWQHSFKDVLSSIGTNLLYPLLAKLPTQTKRLIFIPSGGLFLLPLHAVPLYDEQPLCQRYCISYAPSIQIFREMVNKSVKIGAKDFYAVINPQEDPALVFSRCEGQFISKLFQYHKVDVGIDGTLAKVLDNVPGREYLHFSCHGNYNWNYPSQSALYLAGGRTLSLADLQSDILDMSSARLVTLSACESGITDVKGSADEFVGLPAGFMLSGVPCVVSSLWAVSDISTALLMERFYSNYIVSGMDIPLALQDAQLWVRDLTSKQVADYVKKCYNSGKGEGKRNELIEKYREMYFKMAKESPNERPFLHPYYWAAFTVNGA